MYRPVRLRVAPNRPLSTRKEKDPPQKHHEAHKPTMTLTRRDLLPPFPGTSTNPQALTCPRTVRPYWAHAGGGYTRGKSCRRWCRVARPSRPIVGKKRTPGYVCVTGDSGSCVVTMEPRKKTGEKSVEEGTNRISVVV